MRIEDYSKINILGLGETLKFFHDPKNLKIGVNDIWKYVSTEYIVCVDGMHKFTSERLETIKKSNPLKFFTQLPEWEPFFSKSFTHIKIEPIKEEFTAGKIYHSNNSTFVACCIAFNMGAKDIVLHGVDFNSHKNLSQYYQLKIISNDFKTLRAGFMDAGVRLWVGHRASKLSEILPIWKD